MKYKGFLHYQEPYWLLSSQAKINSCCGYKDVILINYQFPKEFNGKQVILTGDIKPSELFSYQLINVSIEPTDFNFPYISLGILFAVILLIIFKKARQFKKLNKTITIIKKNTCQTD